MKYKCIASPNERKSEFIAFLHFRFNLLIWASYIQPAKENFYSMHKNLAVIINILDIKSGESSG